MATAVPAELDRGVDLVMVHIDSLQRELRRIRGQRGVGSSHQDRIDCRTLLTWIQSGMDEPEEHNLFEAHLFTDRTYPSTPAFPSWIDHLRLVGYEVRYRVCSDRSPNGLFDDMIEILSAAKSTGRLRSVTIVSGTFGALTGPLQSLDAEILVEIIGFQGRTRRMCRDNDFEFTDLATVPDLLPYWFRPPLPVAH